MEQWKKDLYAYSYAIHDHNFLSHHGILGQRWGKRNGPPYPLDASDHSASEKKAGWKKSLGSKGSLSNGKSGAKSSSTDMANTKEDNIESSELKKAMKEYSVDKFVKSKRCSDTFSFLKDLASMYKERNYSKDDIKNALVMEAYESNIDEYFLDFLSDTSLKNANINTINSIWMSSDFNKEVHKVVDEVVKKAMQ